MKTFVLLISLALAAVAQTTPNAGNRWFATTGDASLNSAGMTATIQQPASNASQVVLDQIVVYCSVACNVTQAANGSAATATAGTVTPILPAAANAVVPITFWTASNVGAGTAQGGIVHLGAAATQTFCLSRSCGNPGDVTLGSGAGAVANYSVTISTITGTANVTFYGHTL